MRDNHVKSCLRPTIIAPRYLPINSTDASYQRKDQSVKPAGILSFHLRGQRPLSICNGFAPIERRPNSIQPVDYSCLASSRNGYPHPKTQWSPRKKKLEFFSQQRELCWQHTSRKWPIPVNQLFSYPCGKESGQVYPGLCTTA